MRVVRSRRRRAVVRGLHAETRSAQLPLRARLVRTSESESSECESESVLSAPVEPVESDEELPEDSARRRCLIPLREERCESPVCSSKVIWQRRRWVDVKERGRAKRRRPPLPPRLAADLLTPAAHHRVTRTHQSHHGFVLVFFLSFLKARSGSGLRDCSRIALAERSVRVAGGDRWRLARKSVKLLRSGCPSRASS